MLRTNITSDQTYTNFDIKLKEPMHKLHHHTDWVNSAIILKDGRFVTGSADNSIIIYNNKIFQPDIIIKEHNDWVRSITLLSSGILVSCSDDNTIKLFNFNNNKYNILQTLNYHTNYVYKLIELNNRKLVWCSKDESIIFYFKDNNQYTVDYKISTKGACHNIIQTKENEICYSEEENKAICFFDLSERKLITKINNISHNTGNSFKMISKDLLLIGGDNVITIINVNNHNVIRTIESPNSSSIIAFCLLNKNILLTGDENGRIIQWKIDGDKLIRNSIKEHAIDGGVNVLIKLGNGLVMSGGANGIIKIW